MDRVGCIMDLLISSSIHVVYSFFFCSKWFILIKWLRFQPFACKGMWLTFISFYGLSGLSRKNQCNLVKSQEKLV